MDKSRCCLVSVGRAVAEHHRLRSLGCYLDLIMIGPLASRLGLIFFSGGRGAADVVLRGDGDDWHGPCLSGLMELVTPRRSCRSIRFRVPKRMLWAAPARHSRAPRTYVSSWGCRE
ncbi:hypothetical protein ACFPRL_32215 [Pseudoclavibacter helvolus]